MADKRLKASDFPTEVLALFDRYVHGMIDRRGFLGACAMLPVRRCRMRSYRISHFARHAKRCAHIGSQAMRSRTRKLAQYLPPQPARGVLECPCLPA